MTAEPSKKTARAIRLNLGILWMTHYWLRIAIVIIGIYVSLPFIAPTLMKIGLTGPASVIYTIYSPLCHQFAFRSVFLYGEQPFYPRDIAATDYRSYESYSTDYEYLPDIDDPTYFGMDFWLPARSFVGNEQMGYKTTLCARDVAIYLGLFAGALIYSIPAVRRRLRPVPLWLYVIAGLGPIGLDGFSQLLSYPPFEFWPVRETAPFFRVVTGACFGLMNAWLGFPYIEMSMQDTYAQVFHKLRRAGVLPQA